MEDAFTIEQRLRKEALGVKDKSDASWQMLRSDIYVRDKGICWICNTFAELKDYDLGHLVDRCNGGQDEYDNLAVMHKSCNLSKPRHTTLEEAMKWKLTPAYLTERPLSMFDNTKSIAKSYSYNHHKKSYAKQNQLSLIDEQANKQLINSYFQAHPELQDTNNVVRLEAIKLLSQILNLPTQNVNNQVITMPRIQSILQRQPYKQPIPYKAKPYIIARRQKQYEELASIIKPDTVYICWIQGRPMGEAMWNILLPPYSKEEKYTIRQTPPGATDNGKKGVRDTLQIIGGNLTTEVNIDVGFIHFRISPTDSGMPRITFLGNDKSNTQIGLYKTIGIGRRQIPINAWLQAKAQGISLNDFKEAYRKQLGFKPVGDDGVRANPDAFT